MTTIQFYHLTTTPLERALPKLLEKAYGSGLRTLLVADSEDYVEHLNQLLWTYDADSFLPHGSVKDGNAEQQLILISTAIEPANGAKLLMLTNGATPEKPDDFERIIDIFDGNDTSAVEKARTRWKSYKNSGCEIAYLKQTESGGWEKRA